jgi:glyoxylase-like metal-dependent hydrolase (beta-lactamase superfamily II)
MRKQQKLILVAMLSALVAGSTLVYLGVRGFEAGKRSLEALPSAKMPAVRKILGHKDGIPLSVLAIPTGSVSVKSCHAVGCLPEYFPYPLRFLSIVFDSSFGTTLPIWVYAIVHPEGVWLVDAGPSPGYNDENAWAPDPVSGTLMRGFLRIHTSRAHLIATQLEHFGLGREHVRGVILTHQHVDHTGQVGDFSDASIWTTKAEDNTARFIGAVPFLWRRPDTRVRYVDEEGKKQQDSLTESITSVDLTQDRALQVFHTPGHTPGSLSVRLNVDEGEFWFIGDTSFRASDVNPARPTTGMHFSVPRAREAQAWLSQRPEPKRFFTAHEDEIQF